MLDGIIIRGTTPTHDFDLPYPVELISDIIITYGQNGRGVLTKKNSACTLQGVTATVSLTQSETLLFVPNKVVDVEIKIRLFDKRVVQTEEPIALRVVDTMNEEVFE